MDQKYITLVERDEADTLKTHIDHGLNVKQTDQIHRTFLHIACEYNSPRCVRLLIEEGADIQHASTTYPAGGSPLHIACRYGHVECADILLKAGADMYSTDNMGDTAFHDACTHNSKDCAEVLIEAGANIEEEVEDLRHDQRVNDDVKQLLAPYFKI